MIIEPNSGKRCLPYEEYVLPTGIVPKGTYDAQVCRGNIVVHGRGGNGSKVLIEFDSLPLKYQDMWREKYGDPDEYMKKQPIQDKVVMDVRARDYYAKLSLPGNKRLSAKHIEKYTKAASWLNMLVRLTAEPQIIKVELGMNMEGFWKNVALLISTQGIALPKNRITLQRKIATYKEDGYACLIDGAFGNACRAKVKDELSESLMLEMIAHNLQFDDTIIMEKYNEWAKANGRPVIQSKSTIGKYRREHNWEIKQFREGKKKNYDTHGLIISRHRPSAPLLLVNSDDNELDLFFMEVKEKNGKNVRNPYKRFVVMVVIDTYNDYILGYAIGETQTNALVVAAYLDAMHNIKRLTGSYYLPVQIQTDRFGLKSERLKSFYESLAIYTPAAAHNARSKPIERSFGIQWHQQLKNLSLHYGNYAGYNVKAKQGLNPDMVALNKKNYPEVSEAPQVIGQFIEMMRRLPASTVKNEQGIVNGEQSMTREEQWVAAFKASEKSKSRYIDDELMLMLFGRKHDTGNQYEGNTITNEGVVIKLDGVKYKYMVPEYLYLENIGKSVSVYYDTRDMSRVLVTDEDSLRFVAHAKGTLPMAIADYEPGDGMRLSELMERKKRDMKRVSDRSEMRKKVLEEGGINADSVLKAGVLDKGLKRGAEQKYLEQQYGENVTDGDFEGGKGGDDTEEFDMYAQM